MNPVNKRTVCWTIFFMAVVFVLACGGVPGFTSESWAEKPKADVDYWLKELKDRQHHTMKVASVKTGTQIIATDDGLPKTKMVAKAKNKAHKGPKKISVDFYKVDLHNVFRLLGQVSGKNVVVDEGVKGTLTLALDNVPWTFVLEVIKNLKGLESIEKNNTIMIYPKKKSVEWAGEPSASGTLETMPGSVEVSDIKSRQRRLTVENKKKSKTPLKQIMKAEKLIKKAASQEKHGNIIGAYQSLKKAAELWPDNLRLLDKLAALALQRNDNLAAFNYAKRALKLEKKDAEAAAIAAIALDRMDRPEDAREYFELAMNIKPTKDILWNYAVFSFSQGNYRQALRLINRIEANYSITPDMLMLKAQCYEYLSKIPQAVAEYRSLLSSGENVPTEMIRFAKLRLSALTSTPVSNK